MHGKLRFAAYAGIIYLLSSLPELTIEALQEFWWLNDSLSGLLFVSYLISICSTIFFYFGFIVLAKKYGNYLLEVSSWIIIFTTIFYYIYAWYDLEYYEAELKILWGSILFLFGFSSILFGIGIKKLAQTSGRLADYASVLEIIIGISLVTIILFLLGLILAIPATLLEILILLKESDLARKQNISQADQALSQ